MGSLYRIEQGYSRGKKIPITKSRDWNFCPSVWCPHCSKHQKAAVSGFGGKISKRTKPCKFCGKLFEIIIETKTQKVNHE